MEDLATLIVAIHLLWIIWVIFGALWTRGRRFLTVFHILALVWGIVVETSALPCPLTLAEDFLQGPPGLHAYQSGFLLRCLDRIVYPDLPDAWITGLGVAICVFNLALYVWRWRKARSSPRSAPASFATRQNPS